MDVQASALTDTGHVSFFGLLDPVRMMRAGYGPACGTTDATVHAEKASDAVCAVTSVHLRPVVCMSFT